MARKSDLNIYGGLCICDEEKYKCRRALRCRKSSVEKSALSTLIVYYLRNIFHFITANKNLSIFTFNLIESISQGSGIFGYFSKPSKSQTHHATDANFIILTLSDPQETYFKISKRGNKSQLLVIANYKLKHIIGISYEVFQSRLSVKYKRDEIFNLKKKKKNESSEHSLGKK